MTTRRLRVRARNGRTTYGPKISGEPLSGCTELVRLRIGDRHELTCTPDEVAAIVEWAIALDLDGITLASAPLPVAEYTHRNWSAVYRWSLEADRIYRNRAGVH